MKRYLPILIALVVGLILGALLFPRNGTDHHHEAAPAGQESTKSETWTCSMHPQVKAPKPGKCPICAMDLIPLSQLGANRGGREFAMSEAAKKLAGIQTVSVERKYPEAHIHLYGTVSYDETQQKTISARFPGRIERLFVDYTGIRVKKGDHLATIYSPELLTAQTELLTAKRFNNEDALRASRDKLRLWGFSAERIRQIEESGKASDELTIDAPVAGIVTHKNVSEGDYLQTGMPLFRINTLDQLWILFDAYESDKPWLRFGQPIEFSAEALPGKTFPSQISFLSPDLDPKTRTFGVRANIDNPGEQLKPGMFVRGVVLAKVAGIGKVIDPTLSGKWISPMHPEIVKDGPGKCDICGMDLVPAEELGYTVATPDEKPPLVIPSSSVLHTGKRSIVYIEKPGEEEPVFEGREILLGPRADDLYIVEAGLRQGEKVVVEGAFAIDSALQIQAQPSMMLPPENPDPIYQQFETPEEFRTHLKSLLETYFSVQQALAGDDETTAKAKAQSMSADSEKAAVALPDENAKTVWLKLKETISSEARLVSEAKDIKGARTHFEPLSDAMEQAVRHFGSAEAHVFVAHCPMAFSNKGADWLQETNDVLNPYFGSSMLTCGEIKEELTDADIPETKIESKDDGKE